MATLIRIDEPDPAPALRPEWGAVLSLACRPLYSACSAWAAIAVAFSSFAPQWLHRPPSGVACPTTRMLGGFGRIRDDQPAGFERPPDRRDRRNRLDRWVLEQP